MGFFKKLKKKRIFRKAYGISTAAQRAVGSAVTGKKFKFITDEKIKDQFKTVSAGNAAALAGGKAVGKVKVSGGFKNVSNMSENKKKGKFKNFIKKHGNKLKSTLGRQISKTKRNVAKNVGGSVNFGTSSTKGYIPIIIAVAFAIVIAFGSGMVKLKKGRR